MIPGFTSSSCEIVAFTPDWKPFLPSEDHTEEKIQKTGRGTTRIFSTRDQVPAFRKFTIKKG